MSQQVRSFHVRQAPVKQYDLGVKIAPDLFCRARCLRSLDGKTRFGQGLPQKIADAQIIFNNQYSSFLRVDDFLLELNNTGSTPQRKRPPSTLGGILIEK